MSVTELIVTRASRYNGVDEEVAVTGVDGRVVKAKVGDLLSDLVTACPAACSSSTSATSYEVVRAVSAATTDGDDNISAVVGLATVTGLLALGLAASLAGNWWQHHRAVRVDQHHHPDPHQAATEAQRLKAANSALVRQLAAVTRPTTPPPPPPQLIIL
jgi:hypothetical protein